LSTKFSHSPALHLTIASSRRWRALQSVYLLAAAAALAVIGLEGRPALAALLGLALCCSLPRLYGQPTSNAVLCWDAGRWELDSGRGARPIQPLRGCRVTPWAVLLTWREPGGKPGRLWIFADAVDPDGWRRLRVRLRLRG
jgi:hypothetical protein